MKDTDAAWAAGFFDGEGSVTLTPRNGKGDAGRVLLLRASQRIEAPLLRLKTLFGGSVYADKKESRCYYWQAGSKMAATALEAMLPYLCVKHELAAWGLRHQATKHN